MVLKFLHSLVVSNPTSDNINTFWNLGSLLGMCWAFQVISGIFLCFFFYPYSQESFTCAMSISTNYFYGWGIRFFHANMASMFLAMMYLHMAKALLMNSFNHKKTWLAGCVILIITMGSAFLGYALPMSNMSFWGVNVITSFLMVIPVFGNDILKWVWAGFMVNDGTLSLFFTLHWLLPLVLSVFITSHLVFLHSKGSTSSGGILSDSDKVYFFPFYVVSDSLNFVLIFIFCFLVCFLPYFLGDCETMVISSNTSSPLHIVPEWYFLAPYAILRSCPNKAGGIALFALSVGMFFLTVLMKNKTTYGKYATWFFSFMFFFSCIILTWIGGNEVEAPYILLGQVFTFFYFFSYLFVYWISLCLEDMCTVVYYFNKYS